MALQAKAGFIGLVTNVAETQSPEGALIEAENVVIRKPGAIECRDGVNKVATVAGGAAVWGYSWRSKDFFVRNNGANTFDWRDTAGGTYLYTDPGYGTSAPQPMRRDIFSRAEARGSVYVPQSFGAMKMDTEAGPWKIAGLPLFAAVSTAVASVGGTWLPNTEKVAYRVQCYRKDANGMEIRSIPGGAVIVQNGLGVASAVTLTIVCSNTTFFDYVEVYRTRNFASSVTPDDEMQLVATLPAAASIVHVDTVTPSTRGATQYTSPSRGGINEQNTRPPAAAVNAAFRGSMFYGNIRGPRRIQISVTWSGDLSGSASGVGYRQYTATRTNGSNDLTLLSSTVGLEKGQVVFGNGIAAFAYVTNIVGATVTLSQPALSSAAGDTYTFYDAVKTAGMWIPVEPLDAFALQYAPGFVQAYGVTPPVGGYNRTYVVEALVRSTTSMTIQATHGTAYLPALPSYDSAATSLSQDVFPGAIVWSKPDEPEHVRLSDYAFVGDAQKAVLGLVPTRDALFVLKEDGVFRLTGFNGEWRIDPFDPNCFCVLPMGVQVLNGRALFLSAEGVVALDDGGVELVSRSINDQVKLTIDQIMANWRSTGFYEVNGSQGASYSAVFDRENEYTLMRSTTDNHLVYNADTRAWTTWKYHAHSSESYSNRAVFAFGRTGRVIYAMGSDYYETMLSTQVSGNYERYDRATSITVNSYASGIATLSAAVTALADDVIEDSNERFWRVTADVVASASVPVVLEGGSATMGAGAGFLYRSQRCKVVATGYTEPGAMQKRWGSFMTAWQRLQGVVVLKYGYQSSESPDWAEEDARSSISVSDAGAIGSGYTDYALGFSATGRVPNAHARSWLLRARVRWAMPFGQAQLEAMAAEFTTMIPGSHHQVTT